MKNGSIVREKSFKNSRSTAGIASVMATIPHIKFKSIFGLGEDCIRKDQCTTVDVFLTSSSLFLRRYQKAVQESNRKKIYRRRNHADIECRCKCDSTRKQTRSGTIPCPSHLVVFFLHRPAQDQDKSFRGDHSRRTSHRRQRSSLPLHRLASGRSEAPSGNQSHTHAGLQHDQAVIRKYGRKTSAPVYYV